MQATGLSRAETVGTLELLWLFTMEQSPSGDVGRWGDMDLEAEMDWRGEPGALVSALVDAGWIDRCGTHRLVIHDWADHLPDFLQKRVDRGTLKIAAVSPCPDDGTRRPPSSANGGIREGKPREAKQREGERSEVKTPPAPRSCVCPDELSGDQSIRALEWAAGKGFTGEQLAYAWDRVRDWSHSKQTKRTDWLATLRNAMTDGWALKGYGQSPTGEVESPAQAKARRTKEAGAKAYEMIQQRKLELIGGGVAS
jgi:hypothetical protein